MNKTKFTHSPKKAPEVSDKMVADLHADLDRLTDLWKRVRERQRNTQSLQELESVLDHYETFADELTKFYRKHPWFKELRRKPNRKTKTS